MGRKGNLDQLNRSFTCVACVGAKAAKAVTHFDKILHRLLPGPTVLLSLSISVYVTPRPSVPRNSTEKCDVTGRAVTTSIVTVNTDTVKGVKVTAA